MTTYHEPMEFDTWYTSQPEDAGAIRRADAAVYSVREAVNALSDSLARDEERKHVLANALSLQEDALRLQNLLHHYSKQENAA